MYYEIVGLLKTYNTVICKTNTNELPKISFAKKQRTLLDSLNFSGVGLHTGKKIKMSISPAPVDSGVTFRKKGKNGALTSISAHYKNVQSTNLCTVLSNNFDCMVSTVEHVLSALHALEIDNVYIDIDSNEIPVYDGSSQSFVEMFESVGYQSQEGFKKYIKILKTVEVLDNGRIARVSPFDNTLITSEINFKHKAIGKQSISLLLTPELYITQISPARTFGFANQVESLRKSGLALGGSLDNAIVLDEDRVLNPEGLRFSDEFVRHKVLDFIGDISLAGSKILGSFFTSSSGHEINIKLLEKIFESQSNWTFTTK